MVQLVTPNQFQLTPDVSALAQGFQQGQQIRGQFDQRKAAQAQAERAGQVRGLTGQALAGDKAALTSLGGLDIDQQTKVVNQLRQRGEDEAREQKRENEVLTRTALDALTIQDPVQMRSFLSKKKAEFSAEGRDTSRIDSALAGDDAALMQAVEFQAREGQKVSKLFDMAFPEADTEKASKTFDQETKLRNEFEKITKPFSTQASAFGRIQAAADKPDAAGDLALIFSYMKVLDPGSTVREGEFATAQNADGVSGRIQSLYNNVLRGERLNDSQRTSFVSRARKLFDQAEKQNKKVVSRYRGLAKKNNLSPDNVVRDISAGLPDAPVDLSKISDEELARMEREALEVNQ